ncbi:sialidase family protein [Chelativorans alearense]|uniref:sialidase family protein n=1 Tax=Chelativorans alearense TaxID=2681495 RepID=UPI001969E75D|nr:exo-alpha-sialidase [Chelativorans alearense]
MTPIDRSHPVYPVHPPLAPEAVRDAMDGVLRPNPGDSEREEAWLASPVPQSHAANLLELANGDLACVWFAGSQEGRGDVCIFFARLKKGSRRWSEPVRLTDDMERSEQNPFLFSAPDGRLWLVYTSQIAGDQATALVKYRVSEDNGETFGPVGVLFDEPGTFVRHPIVVNGAGEWLLPVFLCRAAPGKRWRGHNDSSAVMISRDAGKNWRRVEVPGSLGAVHMDIVPLQDDQYIAAYRSRFADSIKRSISRDGGHSWTAPEPTDLPNNNSSIQMIKLQSGRLAIVYNHISAADSTERRAGLYDEIETHGNEDLPPPGQPRAIWGTPRAPMTIALSEDGGRTFPIRRDIETGDGNCLSNNSAELRNREFSYPTICQGSDGTINVAFTYYRQAIKHVRFSEEWVLAAGS